MEYLNRNEEILSANSFSFYCFKLTALIMAVVCTLDYLGVFIVERRLVTITFIGCIIFFALACIVKYTLGFEQKGSSFILLFLLTAMFSFGHTMLSYHVTLFMMFPVVCSVMYHEKIYMYYTFILMSIGFIVSDILSFKYGLGDSNMLLVTTTTIDNIKNMIIDGNYIFNSDISTIGLLFTFPKIMALFGFMLLLNTIKKSIQDKTVKEIENRRKAEIDSLTNLYNRNKFNSDIETLDNTEVSVIYLDVNNLKKVNDSLGHEFGDILIIGLSDILRSHQSDNVSAYRIGGDEFVVIIRQPKDGYAKQLVSQIRKESENINLESGLKLSVAIGYAESNGRPLQEVLHEADENMYVNKFEIKNGII